VQLIETPMTPSTPQIMHTHFLATPQLDNLLLSAPQLRGARLPVLIANATAAEIALCVKSLKIPMHAIGYGQYFS
jgi:hypothetical protein